MHISKVESDSLKCKDSNIAPSLSIPQTPKTYKYQFSEDVRIFKVNFSKNGHTSNINIIKFWSSKRSQRSPNDNANDKIETQIN